jgi:C4-dicarboxylate transporter DctM subunit
LESISGAVIPFVITYIVGLVILVLFPEISLFLPRLIFR